MVLLIILCLIYILSLHEGLFHIMWVGGTICHDIKLNNIIHKLFKMFSLLRLQVLDKQNKMFKGKPLTDMCSIFTSLPNELLDIKPGRDHAVLFQVGKILSLNFHHAFLKYFVK